MEYFKSKALLNNKGSLHGTITSDPITTFEVEGETFYEGKIEVKRLSLASDIIPFTISEKILKGQSLSLLPNTEFTFAGEFRSYNRIIDEKSRLILSFFVKEVCLGETEMSLNELSLTGFICKEPVYRTTPFNRQICDVLVAVNRPSFNKSDYIPCILWGRNACLMQNQKVGTKVTIIGRIQSRIYKKDNGNGQIEQRTAYEVSGQQLTIEQSSQSAENEESIAN